MLPIFLAKCQSLKKICQSFFRNFGKCQRVRAKKNTDLCPFLVPTPPSFTVANCKQLGARRAKRGETPEPSDDFWHFLSLELDRKFLGIFGKILAFLAPKSLWQSAKMVSKNLGIRLEILAFCQKKTVVACRKF